MKRVNFHYSLKNTTIPSNQSYLKCMVEKIESLIRRMRWKAHYLIVTILKIVTFQTIILDLNQILHTECFSSVRKRSGYIVMMV